MDDTRRQNGIDIDMKIQTCFWLTDAEYTKVKKIHKQTGLAKQHEREREKNNIERRKLLDLDMEKRRQYAIV